MHLILAIKISCYLMVEKPCLKTMVRKSIHAAVLGLSETLPSSTH